MSLIASFLRNEQGATAIEYGLIAAGIAVAIVAAVISVGSDLNGAYGKVDAALP